MMLRGTLGRGIPRLLVCQLRFVSTLCGSEGVECFASLQESTSLWPSCT